jgi:hypothetical protein
MHRALELHDSEVESISVDGPRLIVRFSNAYIHQSEGHPGVTPGDVFLQSAELVFSDVNPLVAAHARGALLQGVVAINESEFSMLPLPFQRQGQVNATFVFSSGERVRVEARSVDCSLIGKARWLEKYDG